MDIVSQTWRIQEKAGYNANNPRVIKANEIARRYSTNMIRLGGVSGVTQSRKFTRNQYMGLSNG